MVAAMSAGGTDDVSACKARWPAVARLVIRVTHDTLPFCSRVLRVFDPDIRSKA
jgi:hypothetical protein